MDFDGTITKTDTCLAVTKAFAKGDWKSINLQWEQKMLTTKEAATKTFKLFDTDKQRLKKFLYDNIEIDEHFFPFLNQCKKKDYKVYILSDGYDLHIDTIFEKYNINLPYYANNLVISDSGFKINAVHNSEDCGRCGTCKTKLINNLKPKDGLMVYIGDGYSDMCAAKNADIIFAKDALLSYCRKNQVPAHEFRDFSKINNWLLNGLSR